jgi:hypothetical protein
MRRVPMASRSELEAGIERLGLVLHSDYAEDAAKALWTRQGERMSHSRSGWRHGAPQCAGCRRILSAYGGWCESCHAYSGRR